MIQNKKPKRAHSRLSWVDRSIARASGSLHVRGEPVMILSERIEEGHNQNSPFQHSSLSP